MPLDFTKTRVPGIAQSFRSAIDSGSLMSSTSPLVQKAAQLNYQGLASAGKSLGKGISDAGAAIGAIEPIERRGDGEAGDITEPMLRCRAAPVSE